MSCPKDCHEKKKQCCGVGIHIIPAALGDDTGKFKPENGAFHNMFVEYKADDALYFYANDGSYIKIKEGK